MFQVSQNQQQKKTNQAKRTIEQNIQIATELEENKPDDYGYVSILQFTGRNCGGG